MRESTALSATEPVFERTKRDDSSASLAPQRFSGMPWSGEKADTDNGLRGSREGGG